METAGSELYNKLNEKMGETTSLPVEKLGASEFNTRSSCIDRKHVEHLAGRIRERGFHPKRAISVNVIKDAGGNVVCYRVAAGIHRLEAAKLAGLADIPALLYYNLTEDEECLLDKWDNEMDEDHKPIHFLEEAEHYKYLQEVKGWSVRQIARNKGISKSLAGYRLQLSFIPDEAKRVIREVSIRMDSFQEKYFQYICKLSDPHIITICAEIAERGGQAEQGAKDKKGRPIHPMRQAEIKTRVDELLKEEKAGKTVRREKVHIPAQIPLALFEEEELEEEERYETKTVITEAEPEEMPAPEEPQAVKVRPEPAPLPEIPQELAHRSTEKSTEGMRFDRCPRWLKLAGLLQSLGSSTYIGLKKLIEYDIWFRSASDEPFFLSEETHGDPLELIAEEAGVERDHLQKRILPTLRSMGFIDYWNEKGLLKFKLNWDCLYEVYRKKAYGIPFKEEGLKNMSADFSGIIRPTPFHHLRIEKSTPITWEGKKPEAGEKNLRARGENGKALRNALKELKPPMEDKEIAFCLVNAEETETALKLLKDMSPERREKIGNEAGYVLEMVRRGPQVPEGFITPQELREREEKREKRTAFFESFKEADFRYFIRSGKEYEIITVLGPEGFMIRKEDGQDYYVKFDDWLDMKHFK